MSEYVVDFKKRRFLTGLTSVVGAVGAVGVAIPFLSTLAPSEKAKAVGAPVDVDISKLEAGQLVRVLWRKKPVWIFKRSQVELNNMAGLTEQLSDPDSQVISQQQKYTQNPTRSIKPEIAVIIGICTHLGCSPIYRPEIAPPDLGNKWKGGFYCACHGSRFDLAGRVYKGVPAPTNLPIPPHFFSSDTTIRLGVDPQEIA